MLELSVDEKLVGTDGEFLIEEFEDTSGAEILGYVRKLILFYLMKDFYIIFLNLFLQKKNKNEPYIKIIDLSKGKLK